VVQQLACEVFERTAVRWAFWSLMQQDWAGVALVYQVFKVTSGDPEDGAQQ